MEEKTVENKPENSEKKRRKLDATVVLNLISYPAAWAAGAAYAWQYVRQESYKVLENLGMLDKKIPEEGKDPQDWKSFNGWLKEENAKLEINGDSQKAQAELRKKIEAKKKALFKSMGYKNIYHNWEVIAKNNKAEGAALMVGGAAIALGAFLIAANSKDIITSLFAHDNGDDTEKKRKNSFVATLTDPMSGLVPPESSRTR